MPHQCVRCNKMHPDASSQVLKGCECGGRIFYFIKKEKLQELKKSIGSKLSYEEKKQVEEDILDMIGAKHVDKPVILDFESINVLKPGKYELDLVQLFKGEPLIFKIEEGKYIIDIAETFNRLNVKRAV